MPNLPLVPGTLAEDCYPASPTALYNEMFAKGYAVASNIVALAIQDDAPTDLTQGWIPTSSGVPIYPGYVFVWHAVLGHWVSRHPIAPSDDSRRIYVGNSGDVPTYDYGDATYGAMWEIDTAFDGRVPIGAGTIPTSSPAATVAVQGTQDSEGVSGEYAHTLTEAEGAVGAHVHPVGVCDPATDDGFFNIDAVETTPSYTGHYITGSGSTPATAETTANLFTLAANNGNGVTSDPHNNLQPFYGVFFLKRTSREFIVAA